MNELQEKLQRVLQGALSKQASESDEALIANAEQTPKATLVSDPEAGQTGAASEIVTDAVGAEGLTQPGTNSEITEVDVPAAHCGGIDAACVAGNEAGEAADVLSIKEGEVTKEESIDVINKAANAVRSIGARLVAGLDEAMVESFRKEASAPMSAQEMLMKAASEGDVSAQHMVDFLASYELGMMKKANDLEEAAAAEGASSPEQVAELEDALNAAALEDPSALEAEEPAEVDAENEDMDAVLDEVGAEIEAAAQEATTEVAEAIKNEDPSISDDEALQAAQEVVADAIMTMDAQQAIGAMDEDGKYLVDDETAAAAINDLAKTASANPMRGAVVAQLNAKFGLTPDAFAARLGF